MTIPLVSGATIVTTPTAPASRVVTPTISSTVLTSPGVAGPPGPGLQLSGAVATYGDLPTDLGPSDSGAAYVVNSNGKLYVWSGTNFPIEANGSPFKGDTGATGTGISGITLQGSDTLRFAKTDASNTDVVIPTISAAADSADAAAASAADASGSASAASGSATAAAGSATAASGSATSASGSATAAASSATSASTSETEAASHADDAAISEGNASTSATAAAGSASAASSSAGAAHTSELAAAASASAASTSEGNASSSESNAATSETNAASSATAAAASAAEAAEIVGAGVPLADDDTTGGIRLPGAVAGELGGTWDHPAVTGWDDKADLVAGKVPVSQIPTVALVSTQVVTTTAARLAVTADVGDVVVQTGNPGLGTYILATDDPTVDAHWVLMNTPTDAVTSVNGYNGAVVLAKGDVGLGNVDNTTDAGKPVSTLQQAALDAKAATATTITAGTGLTGGGSLAANRTLAVSYGTSAGTAAQGNDSRITGAVPSSRSITAGTGLTGGGDLTADRSLAVAYGTSGTTACVGNDSRLSDQRTPTDSSVTSAKIADGAIVDADINASAAIALSKLATGRVAGSNNGTATSLTVWVGTEAQYIAIGTKDSATLYFRTA